MIFFASAAPWAKFGALDFWEERNSGHLRLFLTTNLEGSVCPAMGAIGPDINYLNLWKGER